LTKKAHTDVTKGGEFENLQPAALEVANSKQAASEYASHHRRIIMQNIETYMQHGLLRLEAFRQEASLMRQLKQLAPRPMKQPRAQAQLKPQNA
jgi:hypothetical protein